MKKLLNKTDVFVWIAREASSRGIAFVYALICVIAQSTHNALLAFDISSFENPALRVLNAIVISLGISLALFYFILVKGNEETFEEQLKQNKIINTFFILEVILNLFYYTRKLVYDPVYEQYIGTGELDFSVVKWINIPVALAISYFIPFILKSYAGNIKSSEKPELNEDDELLRLESHKEYLKIDEIEEMCNNIVQEFSESFFNTEQEKILLEVDKKIAGIEEICNNIVQEFSESFFNTEQEKILLEVDKKIAEINIDEIKLRGRDNKEIKEKLKTLIDRLETRYQERIDNLNIKDEVEKYVKNAQTNSNFIREGDDILIISGNKQVESKIIKNGKK